MDAMDHITKEEREKLVGCCTECSHWTFFIKGSPEQCEECGGAFSQRHGEQITTQRTFNPLNIKKKRARK